MGGPFHQRMRRVRLGEGEDAAGERTDSSGFDERPDPGGELGCQLCLILPGPRTQRRASIDETFEHHRHEIDLGLGAEREGKLNNTAVRRGRFEVALDVRATDNIENNVSTFQFLAYDSDEILLAIVDHAVGTEHAADTAAFRRAVRGKDGGAEGFGELDRRCADSARAAMNEEGLAGGETGAEEDIAPDGEEGFRQAGGIAERDAARYRQTDAQIDGAILGIATTVGQRGDALAPVPAGDVGTDRDDFARDFEAEQVGRAGRWRIKTLTLHDVRAIHARGGDADQHFARAGAGNRAAAGREDLRTAGGLHLDHGHRVGRGRAQQRSLVHRSVVFPLPWLGCDPQNRPQVRYSQYPSPADG